MRAASAAILLSAAAMTAAGVSFAAGAAASASTTAAAGGASSVMPQARSAWDRGDWKRSELLYKQTIEGGGLSPHEALDAYVRLGASESLLKKRDLALVAFRHAALIDPKFRSPSVAGRKGAQLVALAKKQEAKIGPITLQSEIPDNVSAGVPLDIGATLDADHAAILAKIAITASDGSGSPVYADSNPAGTDVHFTIPAAALKTGAVLAVRIDALDSNNNRMASVEHTVNVGVSVDTGALAAGAGAGAVNAGAGASSHSSGSSVMFSDVKPVGSDKAKSGSSDKGGFWSTAWPYVIGGLALAAGGAAVFFETRPGDDVSVGAARINAR